MNFQVDIGCVKGGLFMKGTEAEEINQAEKMTRSLDVIQAFSPDIYWVGTREPNVQKARMEAVQWSSVYTSSADLATTVAECFFCK